MPSTRALEFIRSCQGSDGGWPANLADSESSAWVSALAGMALLETRGKAAACLAAERFVLRSFGKMPKPWILRVAEWMQSLDSSYVDQNYGGWSWNPVTARWVEPTAYALLFLKKLNHFRFCGVIFSMINSSGIILGSRVIPLSEKDVKEGGWNYGNSAVLGEVLRPFPLTTALELRALQNQARVCPEVQASLRYLERAAKRGEVRPGHKAITCLCFDAFGLEKRTALSASGLTLSESTQLFRNAKTVALALMAFADPGGKKPIPARTLR